ncbi:hypothetical protein H9Y04_44735 [Streptomyces sp. TRM66268-LWL]|uniref:Uncharacterized protein n=1 Tax=Streptomyces polyasparticus TaxID=2767826 RepID=A0ABR7SYI0_9ACTN|nr:hypothetical protein [Streptomyces polyasparticus]MBC9719606.1 hypothetical protein [Streptomyces polyasparticus]
MGEHDEIQSQRGDWSNGNPAFAAVDVLRLDHAFDYVQDVALPRGGQGIFPSWLPAAERRALRAHCAFSHCATLVFPTGEAAAMDYFAERGWSTQALIPSVLVKRRLADRYGISESDCPVSVTRLSPAANPQCIVEVFLFPRAAVGPREYICRNERTHNFENHIGFQVKDPTSFRLNRLADMLEGDGRMLFEGAAYNPHEGQHGTTMLYFAPDARAAHERRRFSRWELQCEGDLTGFTHTRPVREAELHRAYTALAGN